MARAPMACLTSSSLSPSDVRQLVRGAGCRSTVGALPGIGPPNVIGLGYSPRDASWKRDRGRGARVLAAEQQLSRSYRALFVSCKAPDGVGQRTRVGAGAGRGLVESAYPAASCGFSTPSPMMLAP
jgi:hypothetical protein